jgi:Spy/CpxP family protein refolding chaperone
MKNTLTKTGLTLALVGAFGLVSFAQTTAPQAGQPSAEKRGGLGRHKRARAFERMAGRHAFGQLNLTDAQREQLRAIRARYQQGFQTQRQEVRQLADARRGGGALTTEQLARLQELRAQMRANAERMRTEMQGVLTPEQQAQLKQQREQFRERREEFKQRRLERRKGRLGAQPTTTPPADN